MQNTFLCIIKLNLDLIAGVNPADLHTEVKLEEGCIDQ